MGDEASTARAPYKWRCKKPIPIPIPARRSTGGDASTATANAAAETIADPNARRTILPTHTVLPARLFLVPHRS
jgi:hypothetical protein